jgi:hypothetical protein
MSVDVAILSGRQSTLPEGWTKHTIVAVFGGAEIDARATPADGASLKFVGVFGGARVTVARGARVSLSGFSLLGGRKVDVESSPDGPSIPVTAYTVLGGIEIRDRG